MLKKKSIYNEKAAQTRYTSYKDGVTTSTAVVIRDLKKNERKTKSKRERTSAA